MRGFRVATAIASAAAAAVAANAGCYFPAASCEEARSKEYFNVEDGGTVSFGEGSSFDIDGKTYASCKEYCAERLEGREIIDCERPKRHERPRDGGAFWQASCEVEGQECRLPEIIRMPSGRRPEGYEETAARTASVGEWLAEVGRLEAASVPAFERLARELSMHGAPSRLVTRARRSMRDEIVHARIVSTLARRHGACVRSARVARLPERSIEAIAIENAVEGCVHETLGAIVAVHQAEVAHDPELRAAFTRIARDETRHAALAWDVLAWSLSLLDPGASRRVRAALRSAASRLDPASIAARSRAQKHELGLPDSRAAARMIAAANDGIWSHA